MRKNVEGLLETPFMGKRLRQSKLDASAAPRRVLRTTRSWHVNASHSEPRRVPSWLFAATWRVRADDPTRSAVQSAIRSMDLRAKRRSIRDDIALTKLGSSDTRVCLVRTLVIATYPHRLRLPDYRVSVRSSINRLRITRTADAAFSHTHHAFWALSHLPAEDYAKIRLATRRKR